MTDLKIESVIILIWLLPVLVQIVLPLMMLIIYVIGRIFARIFGYRQFDGKHNLASDFHDKSVAPI